MYIVHAYWTAWFDVHMYMLKVHILKYIMHLTQQLTQM